MRFAGLHFYAAVLVALGSVGIVCGLVGLLAVAVSYLGDRVDVSGAVVLVGVSGSVLWAGLGICAMGQLCQVALAIEENTRRVDRPVVDSEDVLWR